MKQVILTHYCMPTASRVWSPCVWDLPGSRADSSCCTEPYLGLQDHDSARNSRCSPDDRGMLGDLNRSTHHFGEGLGWRLPFEGTSWSTVQPARDGIELRLGLVLEIGVLREVLTQQPVGVLVGAALPWT